MNNTNLTPQEVVDLIYASEDNDLSIKILNIYLGQQIQYFKDSLLPEEE